MINRMQTHRFAIITFSLLSLLFATHSHAGSLPDFTQLVKEYSPAVVNISTKQKKTVSSRLQREFRLPEIPEDSPLNDLFKHFFDQQPGQGQGQEHFDAQSLGSGFIISEDGYVLTNAHVVNEADEIIVRLSDRREFIAKVIGTDKRSDVALIKIDADDLPVVKIGTAKELEVGEWVLAIGSPFGFDHSVTAGIVSAKGRNLPSENYVPFIQTDVAINPGNSGGPLFDLDGNVVGINSQIYSRTGGFMGLSFSIPIEVAVNVADQLKSTGHVARGWLGVLIQDVTRELADSFGMKHPKGALVAKVLPDSPAHKAGLEAGDVILSFNGEPVHDSSMLPPIVGASRIDKPVEVIVLRSGKEKHFSVDIGLLPDEELADKRQNQNEEVEENEEESRLGLSTSDITPELKRQLKLDTSKGVVVRGVSPGPAKDAGIREGDVIQMINNTRVDNVKEFKKQVAKLPKNHTTAVLVIRRSGPMFLALRTQE